MSAFELELIRRLKERNADRQRATDGHIHPARPIPPAGTKELKSAERAIGFRLPELLRAIFLQVGNGGFGPQYGIIGTRGGFTLENCSLESCYQKMCQLEELNSLWRWPKRLLPVANYGCGIWSCADCDYKRLPMMLWDPNNLDSELEGSDARLNWGNAFWDQGQSLSRWLENWLTDEEEPEPKWPSDAWMRNRLGFALPK